MKCPNCKNEMEKGTDGAGGKFFKESALSGKPIIAYRCPKCGKVELTTEVK